MDVQQDVITFDIIDKLSTVHGHYFGHGFIDNHLLTSTCTVSAIQLKWDGKFPIIPLQDRCVSNHYKLYPIVHRHYTKACTQNQKYV